MRDDLWMAHAALTPRGSFSRVNWRVGLEGHSFDLETLAGFFRDGSTVVGEDDTGYFLASEKFELLDEPSSVKALAGQLLPCVVGVARTLDPSIRPVRLTGSVMDTRGRMHHFVEVGTVEVRSRAHAVAVVTGDDPPGPPPPPGPPYITLASQEPDVAEALQLLGSPEGLDWVALYKVYEIVRDGVGGADELRRRGWVAASELTAFTASANRPDVSGEDARHARMGGGPPGRTMSLGEARQFIPRLVHAWLESLR